MRTYCFAHASEPKLTNSPEVQDAIRGLKVGKAPGPDGIPKRSLKNLPLRVVSALVVSFNAILRTQYFTAAWKHARVFSILKPVNDPALPSSYQPIGLLDTISKLFQKMSGLLSDKQLGSDPNPVLQYSSPALYQGTLSRRD
jgi:hypothetical protein